MTLPASRAPLPTVSKAVGRARLILHQEAQAVAQLADRLDESFCRAVDLIESCTGRVIVSGMGKAGLIGRKIAATFTSTGTGSHFLHPAEAVHGDLGCVWPEDLLLILSHSGRSEEIVRLLPWINQRHIPLIGVTGCQESPLAQASSVLLHLGSIVEAGSLQLAPTSSTTAMLALGDALALVVSERRGFAAEDFARYHPAGSLGRKLANVEDLMAGRPVPHRPRRSLGSRRAGPCQSPGTTQRSDSVDRPTRTSMRHFHR